MDDESTSEIHYYTFEADSDRLKQTLLIREMNEKGGKRRRRLIGKAWT